MFKDKCFVPECNVKRRPLYVACGLHSEHEDELRKLIGERCLCVGDDEQARVNIQRGWKTQPGKQERA
jgi:hypothetical protein